ncbi:metal ABC transporter solute-binding protein, Zn/Mn family [Salinarimonas rosea]|uniref:metal ABC transporter solute-binding protein, Zn/Mn family n=1 Tax=Salinarimonas rosea TaxID=552063 RepID=UPI000427D02C|nr:zinc ABC transporter substrate-binding protein [Salinarimonas rosea]
MHATDTPAPRRRTLLGALAGLAAALALPFAPLPASAEASEPLDVVATTGMIADAARAVGGDAVEVRALMGPGVDPHAYRQTRTDIAALAGADLVLWNGLYLEAQMEEFLLDLAERQPVVAVAEALPENLLIGHDDYEGRYDPHVWMNPNLWSRVVIAVRDALVAVAPEHEAAFRANAEAHLAELTELSSYATRVLGSVPADSRVLLSAHDAFNYFGSAYGYEVIGIQGISTESEAGLQRIAELVDLLVTRDIRAVFVESSVSDRNIRALVEGAAARGHAVEIGGELFSDAMGEPGTYEGTYIGMIDHNTTTIARALGGEATERGMRGRLAAGS